MFDERRFRAQLALRGITVKELASQLGLNEATVYRKIRDDGAFTRDEINRMITVLKIENPMEIFFTEELA